MNKFDILYSTDNRYIDIMLSSILSLICNGQIEYLRLHIITYNFSKEDYKRIELFFKLHPNIEYYFYPLENFNIEKYNIPNWRGSQIANARLFFQDILKSSIDDIDNLLYLDSDTIIVDNLNGLNNYTDGLYAVKEACLKDYYQKLNLHTYYNSGVIFININEWLNQNYQDKIIHIIEKNNIKLSLPDQDIFNYSLSDNIHSLPAGYNIAEYAYAFNNILLRIYFNKNIRNTSYEEIVEEKQNPKILHGYDFSNIKPWESSANPFHNEYMKYILQINPNFEAKELNNLQKLITQSPNLYYFCILCKMYLPEEIKNQVKNLSLYIQNK